MVPIGKQIEEVIRLHHHCSAAEATKMTADILEKVGIPADRYGEYPHQFSGGMKQRVVIAMALVCNPELLIADEPTTALDVTIQAQILSMMRDLKKDFNTSMLLITHDLGVVAETCDRVAIMYAGEIVECGSLADIFENAQHPYDHRPVQLHPQPHQGDGSPRAHPRAHARPDEPRPLLQLCRPLPLRHGALPHR